MIFKQLVLGNLGTNCYLLRGAETRKVLLIDPGGDMSQVFAILRKRALKLEAVLLTHAHRDHTEGIDQLIDRARLKIIMHQEDRFIFEKQFPNLDRELDLVEDGERRKMAGLNINFLHTPGHTPGGLSFIVNSKAVFTGDTLFAEGIGRTDLPYSSEEESRHSIYKKILRLPDTLLLLPGHGFISTVEAVKCDNPYLDQNLINFGP